MLVKNIILMQKLLFALLLSTAEQKPSGKIAVEKAAPCKSWGKRHASAVTAERSSIRTRFSGETLGKACRKSFSAPAVHHVSPSLIGGASVHITVINIYEFRKIVTHDI